MPIARPRLLVVIGTRPEAIKLAPLILGARAGNRAGVEVEVVVTGQHRDMVKPVLSFFQIVPDHDLEVMRPNQRLSDLTAAVVTAMDSLLERRRPDAVVVQGDTTSAMAAALAAYYAHIPVAHVEAGLRSHDLYSPFPEEGNRAVIGRLARWHFAPTEKARANLEREGVARGVEVVGNTVVDALLAARELLRARGGDAGFAAEFPFLDPARRMILVTGHRRESFGAPFRAICGAIRRIADEHSGVQIVYPVHMNPNVREPVEAILGGHPSIHLIEPVDYPRMVWLMSRSYLILTDSGGIQEEAPSLGKPVLVMREVTEREEGIQAGSAVLVGTDAEVIRTWVARLLGDHEAYERMARVQNPYGDGKTSGRILDTLARTIAG